MAVKKITRKVIARTGLTEKVSSPKESRPVDKEVSKIEETGKPKKACFFCQSKTAPSYTDVTNLRRFLTDRAKIVPKLKSSLCSKHQRRVCEQIKYARHLAILPFVPKV